jgi:hypothetical protein
MVWPCWVKTGGLTVFRGTRKSIDAVLRYHYEQGITDRLFTIEDIFVPELLET